MNNRGRSCLFCANVMFVSSICWAQDASAVRAPPPAPAPVVAPVANADSSKQEVDLATVPDAQVKESDDIWNYFSAGILMNYIPKDVIEAAEVRGGKIRVAKRRNFSAAVGLQAFYAFPFLTSTWGVKNDDGSYTKTAESGWGPYVAASLSTERIVSTIGVGLGYQSRSQTAGIRIGLGVVFEPAAQYLAVDFPEDGDAPAESEGVRYVEQTAIGGQLMLTFVPGYDD